MRGSRGFPSSFLWQFANACTGRLRYGRVELKQFRLIAFCDCVYGPAIGTVPGAVATGSMARGSLPLPVPYRAATWAIKRIAPTPYTHLQSALVV